MGWIMFLDFLDLVFCSGKALQSCHTAPSRTFQLISNQPDWEKPTAGIWQLGSVLEAHLFMQVALIPTLFRVSFASTPAKQIEPVTNRKGDRTVPLSGKATYAG